MVKEEILGIVFERAFDSCFLWGSTLRDVGKGSKPELMTWSAWDEMFQLVCDLENAFTIIFAVCTIIAVVCFALLALFFLVVCLVMTVRFFMGV